MSGSTRAMRVRVERTYKGKPDTVVWQCASCDGEVGRIDRFCRWCGLRLIGLIDRQETVK